MRELVWFYQGQGGLDAPRIDVVSLSGQIRSAKVNKGQLCMPALLE